MSVSTIPEFVHTPVDDIPNIALGLRTTFASQKTKPIEWRLVQLRKLYWALKDNTDAINEACKLDLGKNATETYITEVGWCLNDIVFVCNNLAKWAKDESAPDIPLLNKALSPKIRKDPLGAVLIIGTYNFPIQLAVGPLIGAIAAGCTAALKPSESAPHAAAVVQRVVHTALDRTAFTAIQGAVPETTALLAEKWDKIFYTGGAAVARIVARKAAETLTPVTLELGGLNPAIVTAHADLRLAARRLLWGKTLNAGQVCVSQNLTLIDASILDPFLAELTTALHTFFPAGPAASPDYGRLATRAHFDRLTALLSSTSGRILLGGDSDPSTLYLAPTVVLLDSPEDPLATTESFGPLLPLLPVPSLASALHTARTLAPTPLAVYAFGSPSETARILQETRSGGATVNDAFFHASIPTLPFGGVGDSGHGAYRGRASFECFSHRRSVVQTPGWMEKLLEVRYPPFEGTGKLKQFKRMSDLRVDFDREGKVRGGGWVGWLLTLGGRSAGKGVVRWVLVALVAAGIQQYRVRANL